MRTKTTLKFMLLAALSVVVVFSGCKVNASEPQVTVTFNTDGGSPAEIASVTINKGASLGTQFPTPPTKTNYTFAGWFNGNTEYTSTTTISANITLTAKWAEIVIPKVTVTFNTDAGSPAIGPITIDKGSSLGNQFPAAPAKENFNFEGWFNGTTQYTSTMAINTSITLTAKWTEKPKVTVTFNTDAGSPATIASVTIYKGASLGNQFPAEPEKGGYNFAGWFNENTEYLSTTPISENLTLTAKWTLASAGVPLESISLGKTSTTLTLYSSEKLNPTFTPANATNKTITWTSSAPTVASVDASGKITAASVTASLTEKYTVTPATGSAVITGTTSEGITVSITVTTTVRPQAAAVDSVLAMKDQFSQYFMMGNIAGGANDINGTGTTATRLKRHYNILTAENVMKPSYYGGSRSGTTVTGLGYTNSDAFVNACVNNGFKVHAHVLLWHQQNSTWITGVSSASKEDALGAMKDYITQVVTHFKGKIYSWDVLNEVFPDSVTASMDWKQSMRKDGNEPNPWYKSIGYEFVYEAFLAARLADPAAILYYNDFNTDMAGKAAMIRDMVRDVNAQYAALPSGSKPAGDPAGRLLIEGIGMQEHHNTGVSAASIRNTINLFRPLGVKISVSELDVLCQGWSDYSSNPAKNTEANYPETSTNTITNNGFIKAAQLYGDYMKLYIENKDIIERVSLWGVIDSQSWRGRGLPLIFDKDGKAKPSYFKVIDALEQ